MHARVRDGDSTPGHISAAQAAGLRTANKFAGLLGDATQRLLTNAAQHRYQEAPVCIDRHAHIGAVQAQDAICRPDAVDLGHGLQCLTHGGKHEVVQCQALAGLRSIELRAQGHHSAHLCFYRQIEVRHVLLGSRQALSHSAFQAGGHAQRAVCWRSSGL
ncbi:hypothetical protein D3C71_1404760 [compost metagenome]